MSQRRKKGDGWMSD